MGPFRAIVERHPNLSTWAGLSLAFLLVLAFSARGLGLGPRPWLVLGLAAVLVAGACARIIAWEADLDQEEQADAAQGPE